MLTKVHPFYKTLNVLKYDTDNKSQGSMDCCKSSTVYIMMLDEKTSLRLKEDIVVKTDKFYEGLEI